MWGLWGYLLKAKALAPKKHPPQTAKAGRRKADGGGSQTASWHKPETTHRCHLLYM